MEIESPMTKYCGSVVLLGSGKAPHCKEDIAKMPTLKKYLLFSSPALGYKTRKGPMNFVALCVNLVDPQTWLSFELKTQCPLAFQHTENV